MTPHNTKSKDDKGGTMMNFVIPYLCLVEKIDLHPYVQIQRISNFCFISILIG